MGRAGRYTLSVMAWVAAYAGWSSLIGLVVAAVTGDRPRNVSPGASALMTVVGPLVPTLVALWFNDWARDGFPTREQKRAAAARRAEEPREVPVVLTQPVHVTPLPPENAAPAAAAPAPAAPAAAARPETAAPAPVAGQPAPAAARPAPARDVPVVPAHPLGVPNAPDPGPSAGRFPVAPLLRDDLDRG